MSTPPLLMLAEGRKPRPRKPENSEPRPSDRNAEAKIQAAIIAWIRKAAPNVIAFHVPNGGYRILGRDGRSWLIEVKAPGGVMSDDQCDIRDRCTALRVPFAVARSIDDVRQAFEIWGIETREDKR
jgi:hypothetical protein